MALANVACFLARRVDVKRGVLAVDWDLDAPGLHHFFRNTRPPLKVPGSDASPTPKGVIELFRELNEVTARADSGSPSEDTAAELVRQTSLSDYVVKTVVPKVDLMPAGRFDQDYSERVSAFDWRRFFDYAPSLIRILAEHLAEQYDYVLIDSRTGLNDISGICTALLPDQLVFVFTPNRQSLLGGIDVLKKAAVYRRQSDDLRPLTIFPLPSRVDVSEPGLLEKWRFGDPDEAERSAGYQSQFEDVFAEIYELPSCSLKNYFDEVQIQHVPRYSYGEEIAALIEQRGNRLSISRSYAAFTNILVEADSPWRISRLTEDRGASASQLAAGSVKVQAAKEYLSEERFRLKLHDLVAQEVREVLSQTTDDHFPVQGSYSSEEFAVRLHQYEAVCTDLLRIQALLGFWGGPGHRSVLTLGPKRFCDRLKLQSAIHAWLELRWYPGLLLLYSGGIAAVSANRYDNLRELMLTPISGTDGSPGADSTLIRAVARAMNSLHDEFKALPGHEKQFTPRSEYLFKLLQPLLDDLLFLSSDYESAFDRFEVLYALEHASRYSGAIGRPWGPVGRFGWKEGLSGSIGPLSRVMAEADSEGDSWPPIKAGLFGGSVDRFKEVASSYSQSIARLNWW